MTQKEVNVLMLEKVIRILKYDNINPIECWFAEFDDDADEYNPAWEQDRDKFEQAKQWVGNILEKKLKRV